MSETTTRSGTENRRRRHHIDVRCDDTELAAIEAGAARAEMTTAAWLRHLATGTVGPRARRPLRRIDADRVLLAQVLAALGRVGSNINQLAYQANVGNIPYRDEIMEMRAVMLHMRELLLAALGR